MEILAAIGTVSYGVLLVILGLNAVILVHELGHFLVARWCGVRVEKFYIWFDFWGLKFFKFKWGETEYGLGLFPLGGYVKMLGQEDNPGAIQAEIERAKLQAETEGLADETGGLTPPAHAQPAIFSPESYLSKSVPQRLAIIVAGVVMNFLFAIVCAAGAYWIGVQERTPAVGNVIPGSPAWEAGLQPGDRITHIDGSVARAFGDVRKRMIGGNRTIQLSIERQSEEGESESLNIAVSPLRRSGDLMPNIGILSLPTLELFHQQRLGHWEPYYSDETLDVLRKVTEFNPMWLEKVDGQPVNNYVEYQEAQLRKIGQSITGTFRIGQPITGTFVDAEIPAVPMRAIPVRFKMGAITSVLSGSDAEKQGIQAGDTILSVDGDAGFDPLKLPQILLRKVNEYQTTVELVVKKADCKHCCENCDRGSNERCKYCNNTSVEERCSHCDNRVIGEEQTLTLALAPVRLLSDFSEFSMRDSLGSTALGLAWGVDPVIADVDESEWLPGQPVPVAGDRVVSVEFVNCARLLITNSFSRETDTGFLFHSIGERVDLPYIFTYMLQRASLGEKRPGILRRMSDALGLSTPPEDDGEEKILFVRLVLESPDERTKIVDLPILEATDWFQQDRGFSLKSELIEYQAQSIGEALVLGTVRTVDYTLLVYRSVNSLINGTVSPRALNGPVGIVEILYRIALSGWVEFLILLCLIGANLAVINLLPIPPLDGGHVVFLTYEGIFGRPPNELVQVILSYAGLLLIFALMVWTVSLDLACIPRW